MIAMRNYKICCRSFLLLIQSFAIRLGLSVQTEHESLRSEPCPYPLRHQIYLRGKSGFRKLCGSRRFSSRSNPEKKNLRASTAHGRHNKYSSSLTFRSLCNNQPFIYNFEKSKVQTDTLFLSRERCRTLLLLHEENNGRRKQKEVQERAF